MIDRVLNECCEFCEWTVNGCCNDCSMFVAINPGGAKVAPTRSACMVVTCNHPGPPMASSGAVWDGSGCGSDLFCHDG